MQQLLKFSSRWGGSREGAGRKKRKAGTAHASRPKLSKDHPMHVTMKRIPGLGSFRRNGVNQLITAVFELAQKDSFRIVHFSIQADHLHLTIEADDRDAMVRGMRGLGRRLGANLNKFFKRKGPIFAERYHEHILTSLRQVYHALRYVLNNHRKHGVPALAHRPDPLSSGEHFDGWLEDYPPSSKGSWILPRNGMLSFGWRKHHPLIPVGSTPGHWGLLSGRLRFMKSTVFRSGCCFRGQRVSAAAAPPQQSNLKASPRALTAPQLQTPSSKAFW